MIYQSIRIEGNILTDDILQSIASGEAHYQSGKDFGDEKRTVRDEIERAWTNARSFYTAYRSRKEDVDESESGIQITRTLWVSPLLQLLGYTPLLRRDTEVINDKKYHINYPDEKLEGFPILIRGFNEKLDEKPKSGLRVSPHAMLQDYLNVKEEHLYGIVTNGDELRLLRDSSLMTRLSHVSFDLVRMMEESHYSDFQLMYRLLHASRMPRDTRSAAESIIEHYHDESLKSGSRIRSRLSAAVEQCLLMLGTAFLSDPQNMQLRQWADREDATSLYYDWLLKLIYRILFLLVIEERDLIYPQQDKQDEALREKRIIYYRYYSLQRLRRLADKRRYASDRFADLWEQILATFLLFDAGDHGKALGIKPLAGDLFGSHAIGLLNGCRLNNKVLLECIRLLNHFENDRKQLVRVNYASLDVEEFGSVYEGLLEYAPVINTGRWTFSFEQGSGRSISGSHYTPDELVQPLIKHSLDHLIADRTLPLESPAEKKEEAIRKILSLSVCDVACGSGHILLAAARRIGLEVARLRTGEQQPNLVSARIGTRDAIRHCIYGVDKNPLAVTLCKVALWLEAHAPGEPLNFLDHKIKCGDSIVGITNMEELQNGIATEAFKTFEGDDKDLCLLLRQSNKRDRDAREKGQHFTSSMIESVGSKFEKYRQKFQEFQSMPENTIEEINAKRKAYESLSTGPNWWFVNNLANLQVAQFFVSKTQRDHVVTDSDYFDIMAGRKTQTKAEVIGMKEASERKIFHWFLEFPQVFSGSGFDCIIGNPPFLGGKKISTVFGPDYLNWIKFIFPEKGSSDLVGYFFRRINEIVKNGGYHSLISTNTIAQGDTRAVALDIIVLNKSEITYAIRSMKWPGLAAVEVSLITIFKGHWNGSCILDQRHTNHISTHLDDVLAIGEPYKLKQNQMKSFQGTVVLGKGFVLSPEEMMKLVKRNPKYHDVISPFLNGEDINTRVDQSPSRFVINFRDLPKEKCQQEYPDCWNILVERVKPQRDEIIAKGKQIHTYNFWEFWDPRPYLYRVIEPLARILVMPLTSKYVLFTWGKPNMVVSHAAGVVASDSDVSLAILSGTFHSDWAWKVSSTMGGNTLRYTPSTAFEQFPFPQLSLSDHELENLGKSYFEFRSSILVDTQLGLTKIYNHFHNSELRESSIDIGRKLPAEIKKIFNKESWNLYKHLTDLEGTITFQEAVDRISELRRLHKEMDEAVLAAYGWHIDTERWGPAIQLRHDFYEVDYLPENDRVRYTIHPDARKEVLKRLLLLNHEIHEAEERGIPYEQLNEEKIIALLQKKVEKWLPHTDRLLDGSLKSVCAGEDLLPSLHTSTVQSYNAFVVQYGSAIEYELLHKIFVPFNDQFQQQHPDEKEKKAYLDAQIAADKKNNVGKFARMLLKNDAKYTMGDMHFILNLVYDPAGNTLAACTLLQDLRTFVLSRYTDIILTKDFLHRLDTFIKTFRNEAAHTGMVSREEALRCRDEVRGLVGVMVEGEVR